MRWKTILLTACLTFAAARADDAWRGPGWYVMAYQFAVIIWSGPYDSQQACEAARPPDGDPPDFSYGCSYMSSEPSS